MLKTNKATPKHSKQNENKNSRNAKKTKSGTEELKENENDVKKNENEIKQNESEVDENENGIKQNESEVNENENEVKKTEIKIKAVEDIRNNKVEISEGRKKIREKERKQRKRKSSFKIFRQKVAYPFVVVKTNYETKKFIISRSKRKIIKNIREKEAGVSSKFAKIIANLDKKNARRAKALRKKFRRAVRNLDSLEFFSGAKNKRLIGAVMAMFVTSVMIISSFNLVTAYEYSYKGKVLGIVDEQQDVTEIIDVVNSQLTEQYNAVVDLEAGYKKGIEFRRVVSIGEKMQEPDEVLTTLTYMQDITATGYGIFVEDKRTSVLRSEKEAEETIVEILAEYTMPTEGVSYESVTYNQKVTIEETEVKLGQVQTKAQAKETIMKGLQVESGHVVEKGDTMNSLAKKYGITVEEIEAANKNADKRGLILGTTLKIITKEPLLDVEVVADVSTKRIIPFETKETEDDMLFLDTERTTQEGENGEEVIKAKVTYLNGKIIKEDVISKVVTKEPVTEEITIGTRELPPSIGYGTFINPFEAGIMTSPYGMRWGSMHSGVDLAGPVGSPLLAADGGVVSFAGWDGAYGKKIEIDHGDGNKTIYAHCNEIFVSVGDDVYQGKDIGTVGDTGFSTGPHLHFEVYIDGTRIDPATVIPIHHFGN